MISLAWICWNLLLAFIPVATAWLLVRLADRGGWRHSRAGLVGLGAIGLVWLAFLPNSCYLMAEWRHFLYDPFFKISREVVIPGTPQELRIIKHFLFFAAYSGFGVACFALAIRPVERLIRRCGISPGLWAVPFFVAVSLGVYMGLIVRLNSWDLVVRPGYVLAVAGYALSNATLLGVVVAFGGFLWIMYRVVDIWLDGLSARLSSVALIRRDAGQSL